jgi:hypothetical protein
LQRFIGRQRRDDPLVDLTACERKVLDEDVSSHRRVLAMLAYLRAAS